MTTKKGDLVRVCWNSNPYFNSPLLSRSNHTVTRVISEREIEVQNYFRSRFTCTSWVRVRKEKE